MILSVMVNAHHEGRYLTAAFRSVERALAVANLDRFDAEVLLVLDRPDDLTIEVADALSFPGLRRFVVDCGDPGQARNAGISHARGDYVALLDGDDVWGPHWISRALAFAQKNPHSVLHPQIAVKFPLDLPECQQSPDSLDPAFDLSRLLIENAWVSLSLASRTIFTQFPYPSSEDHREFGYEDWAWNCDTAASGIRHRIVPKTAYFIRKRPVSQSAESSAAGALPIRHLLTPERIRALKPPDEQLATDDLERGIGLLSQPNASVAETQIGEWLSRNPDLFDADWYITQVRRHPPTRQSALKHFMEKGRAQNLSPGPWLDPRWYWQDNPDVRETRQPAFDHYVLHGEGEGRLPHPSYRFLAPLRAFPYLFDADWYISQVRKHPPTRQSALKHFMEKGRAQNLSPGPWLDPEWYWQDNPDVGESGQPAFDHYVLHGEKEGRPPSLHFVPRLNVWTLPYDGDALALTAQAWVDRGDSPDVLDADWLLSELKGAVQSETQLAEVHPSILIRRVAGPRYDKRQEWVERAIDGLVDDSFLILVPHLTLGGADRVAVNLARAAAEEIGPHRVFMISTDRGHQEARCWLPPGVKFRRLQITDETAVDFSQLGRVVADLLMAAQPRTVVNVNSRGAWHAYQDYGRQLQQYMSLNATQFARQHHAHGGFGGYGDEFLRQTIDLLDLVLFDNQTFREQLITDLGLLSRDGEKLKVLYQPSPITPNFDLDLEKRNTDRVLWIGRIAREKRPDLLAEVAALMPEREFHVYGGPTDRRTLLKYGLLRDNLVIHGPIDSVEDLDPLAFGALLFTSFFEGMPNVPIEIGSMGLPVVASSVGGLPELIDDEASWPLPPSATAGDYAVALREALDAHRGAAVGAKLREKIAVRHSWAAFRGQLSETGLLQPFEPGARSDNLRSGRATAETR